MSIRNVILIGAGGSLGTPVLQELKKSFNTTILTRQSSKSTFPSDVKVITIADDYPESDLVAAFEGQDAVVSTITSFGTSTQKRFTDAAVKAGIKRFVPAEFGSDSENYPELVDMAPAVWGAKKEQLDYIKSKDLPWTAIANGAFFDWLFTFTKGHFGQIDFDKKTMTIFDDGNAKFSATNTGQVARAVAKALLKPEETKNRFLFIQSFSISQNQLHAALEKVTGDKFAVTKVESKKWFAENVPKAQAGDQGAIFNTLWGVSSTQSDFTNKPQFANGLLGLEEEDFEESLRDALKKM